MILVFLFVTLLISLFFFDPHERRNSREGAVNSSGGKLNSLACRCSQLCAKSFLSVYGRPTAADPGTCNPACPAPQCLRVRNSSRPRRVVFRSVGKPRFDCNLLSCFVVVFRNYETNIILWNFNFVSLRALFVKI